MSTNETDDKEKKRVEEAADQALMHLRAAESDLDSAFRWGVLDLIGGMYVVSGIKHLKIESAKKHIREAMFWLQQFRREGDHTDYENGQYMHLGPFGTILDIGIDGIVPDMYAQARIAGLKTRVREAINRLEEIMRRAGLK
ncbi:MAG: hypothetical protein J6Z22_08435 [Lachnospiraceae bacterium]|nr:hypothetical protein [Lachnospiraceae bacterium]